MQTLPRANYISPESIIPNVRDIRHNRCVRHPSQTCWMPGATSLTTDNSSCVAQVEARHHHEATCSRVFLVMLRALLLQRLRTYFMLPTPIRRSKGGFLEDLLRLCHKYCTPGDNACASRQGTPPRRPRQPAHTYSIITFPYLG